VHRGKGELRLLGTRRDQYQTGTVDDLDVSSRLGSVAVSDRHQVDGARILDALLDERRQRGRVVLETGGCDVLLVAAVDDTERDLQGEQDDRRHRQIRQDEPSPHRTVPRRNPTPRTVSTHRGSPSFFRNEATCTSSVRVGPYQWGSHTLLRSS
jgi:hypothetical protein